MAFRGEQMVKGKSDISEAVMRQPQQQMYKYYKDVLKVHQVTLLFSECDANNVLGTDT